MRSMMSRYAMTISFALIGVGVVSGAPTTTIFTLNTGTTGVTTGTISNGQSSLFDPSGLVGGSTSRSFAAQSFTPSVSGTYTFGVGSATYDAVLVVYQGTFDPNSPGTNVLVVNDDSDGQAPAGSTVTIAGCGGLGGLCPKVSATLTANTTYTVVVTTFGSSPGFTIVPVDFYVYGEPVSVGGSGPAPVPIPTLGEWGMIGLGGLLLLFAWDRLRKLDSAGVA